MTQDEAKAAIMREWRALPKLTRASSFRRVSFAMKMVDKYPFEGSTDPFQVIKGWLSREFPGESW
jgi:hypothetical protein